VGPVKRSITPIPKSRVVVAVAMLVLGEVVLGALASL
jgi:hypothetical protein